MAEAPCITIVVTEYVQTSWCPPPHPLSTIPPPAAPLTLSPPFSPSNAFRYTPPPSISPPLPPVCSVQPSLSPSPVLTQPSLLPLPPLTISSLLASSAFPISPFPSPPLASPSSLQAPISPSRSSPPLTLNHKPLEYVQFHKELGHSVGYR